MSRTETVVAGTLKPDGTLELDEKPNLPAGRVTVVLRPQAEVVLPGDDPFRQRMEALGPSDDGPTLRFREYHAGRSPQDRAGMGRTPGGAERLQEECGTAQRPPEEPCGDGLPRHELRHLPHGKPSGLVSEVNGPDHDAALVW